MSFGRDLRRLSRAPLAVLLAYAFLLQIFLAVIAGAQADAARFGPAGADPHALCVGAGQGEPEPHGKAHDLCCMAACSLHPSTASSPASTVLAAPGLFVSIDAVLPSALVPTPVEPWRGVGPRAPPPPATRD
jgi:hypothetical protein